MQVYFTTLGGGIRRWYSELRQILPTPVIENNVVLYTGLFDIDNSDKSLLSDMTAQVYFVTSAARNVLTIPVGALTYIDEPPSFPAPNVAGRVGGNNNQPGGGGSGFPEGMSEDMRERIRERMASGQGFGGGQGAFGGRPGATAPNQQTQARRPAMVTVVNEDGTQEEREVLIGITSRISAEVISGLEVGDRVVAGILQGGMSASGQTNPDDQRREMFRAMRGI